MDISALMRYPESASARWMFKAPLFLWRMGMQPVIGQVMMVLTQTGRVSGLPRRTMVEYHRFKGNKYVVAAFGDQAQWYQNIMADPCVTIQTSEGVEAAQAVRVTEDEEIVLLVESWHRKNPLMMGWYLESLGINHSAEDIIDKKDRLDILRFDLTEKPTPPPLAADLTWLWAVGAIFLVGWRMIVRFSRDD